MTIRWRQRCGAGVLVTLGLSAAACSQPQEAAPPAPSTTELGTDNLGTVPDGPTTTCPPKPSTTEVTPPPGVAPPAGLIHPVRAGGGTGGSRSGASRSGGKSGGVSSSGDSGSYDSDGPDSASNTHRRSASPTVDRNSTASTSNRRSSSTRRSC
jgi:hypothetical protein